MAQLVLAAAGAAAGNALGWGIAALGMSGSAVGWAIGSLVGSMVGQKGVHNVQPGIGDKSVQASTYGAFQTIVYGTMRVAGNVIDGVSEVREVRTTTRVGKGGRQGEGRGHIYRVEPTGPIENDPNLTDQRFPGNPTRSYRTREPVRIVEEVHGWTAPDPGVIESMKRRMAELTELGIEAMDD